MNYKVVINLILIAVFLLCSTEEKSVDIISESQASLVDYVNPLMGTDSKYTLSNGNSFTINTENNSSKNFYIRSTILNSSNYSNNYIQYQTIQKGGAFTFNMTEIPDENWGSNTENLPYSLSRVKYKG